MLTGAAALAATGLAPALGGCGGGDGGGRTVHFTYMGDAYSQEGWTHRFERFQTEHPAVSLVTKNVPSHNWADFFNRVTTQLAGGQPLDVLDIATEGQRLFASKGLLEPLDHFLRRDRAFSKELHADLHPALEKWTDKYASPDGRTYYLSAGGNPVCMWYNADLLRKAGLEEPGPDWTWEDFYRICVQVKDRTGAYGYAAVASQFDGILPWLLTNGVSTLDESWTRPTVTDPHAIEAAAFNRRLVQEELSPEPGGTF
ncbi:MAG: ABC transporter substrate-binding protein, partial [Nocardioidaceae bacterium]